MSLPLLCPRPRPSANESHGSLSGKKNSHRPAKSVVAANTRLLSAEADSTQHCAFKDSAALAHVANLSLELFAIARGLEDFALLLRANPVSIAVLCLRLHLSATSLTQDTLPLPLRSSRRLLLSIQPNPRILTNPPFTILNTTSPPPSPRLAGSPLNHQSWLHNMPLPCHILWPGLLRRRKRRTQTDEVHLLLQGSRTCSGPARKRRPGAHRPVLTVLP